MNFQLFIESATAERSFYDIMFNGVKFKFIVFLSSRKFSGKFMFCLISTTSSVQYYAVLHLYGHVQYSRRLLSEQSQVVS
jgi:hypothetical protein